MTFVYFQCAMGCFYVYSYLLTFVQLLKWDVTYYEYILHTRFVVLHLDARRLSTDLVNHNEVQ